MLQVPSPLYFQVFGPPLQRMIMFDGFYNHKPHNLNSLQPGFKKIAFVPLNLAQVLVPGCILAVWNLYFREL